ncbi:MAG: sulfite exporter TauE/SafE family protein [Methanophagales archaeon]|nr:sulfite exporter TauE/SafE family protein [Methanophagales archaeon]
MELLIAIVVLVLTGAGVGFVSGLLGIGGSSIMVPITFFVFTALGVPGEVSIKLAFGSNLLVVFPTAVSGVSAHMRKRSVWWKPGLIMGIPGAIGSVTGAIFTLRFLNESILRLVFGLVIAIAAVRMLICKIPVTDTDGGVPESKMLVLIPSGFAIGIICGMLGLGGGIIIVPVLMLVSKYEMRYAIGTSLLIMTFISFAGAFAYLISGLSVPDLPPFSIGYVNLAAWACLAMTSIPIAYIGAITAHKLPATWLRYIFISIMFYIALKMIGPYFLLATIFERYLLLIS